MLEKLWIDLPDARARCPELVDPALRPHVMEYIDKGYTIFRGAVSADLADEIVHDTLAIHRNPERYVLKNAAISKNVYVNPAELTELRVSDRVSDIYGVSAPARQAIFTQPVRDFLFTIF